MWQRTTLHWIWKKRITSKPLILCGLSKTLTALTSTLKLYTTCCHAEIPKSRERTFSLEVSHHKCDLVAAMAETVIWINLARINALGLATPQNYPLKLDYLFSIQHHLSSTFPKCGLEENFPFTMGYSQVFF